MNFPGDALAESGCTGVCRFSFSYSPVTSPGFSWASRFLVERMGVNNQRCTGPGMGGQARRPRSSCANLASVLIRPMPAHPCLANFGVAEVMMEDYQAPKSAD